MRSTGKYCRDFRQLGNIRPTSAAAGVRASEVSYPGRHGIQVALNFLLLMFSGFVNRRQQDVIEYLRTENDILREQLGHERIRFTDDQRHRLALKGKALGRAILNELGAIVTPDTILRWYRDMIAKKYDGSKKRKGPGRPKTDQEIEDLVLEMARSNSGQGIHKDPGLSSPAGCEDLTQHREANSQGERNRACPTAEQAHRLEELPDEP